MSVIGATFSSFVQLALAGDGMEKAIMRKSVCICANNDAIYFIYSSYSLICIMRVEQST
jgi:hypothetical protein